MVMTCKILAWLLAAVSIFKVHAVVSGRENIEKKKPNNTRENLNECL